MASERISLAEITSVPNASARRSGEERSTRRLGKLRQHRFRQSAVVAVEPLADGLHLWIDAHDAPGGCVERAQLVQDLGEARLTFGILIVLRWLGWSAPGISEAEALKLWNIVEIGLGGYVIGRSAEKTLPRIVEVLRR